MAIDVLLLLCGIFYGVLCVLKMALSYFHSNGFTGDCESCNREGSLKREKISFLNSIR